MIKYATYLLFYIIIAPLIMGCALYGPIYKKPPIKTPIKWKSQDKLSKVTDENLPMLAWWEKFNDKELTCLIEKAVNRNNDIQAAIGRVVDAKGELSQIELSIIPSVTGLIAGYSSTNVDLFVPGYNSGFLPSYALNLFQYIRSTQWARAKVEVAAAAKDAVMLSVISQTAAGYFNYLGQNELYKQQKMLVSDTKELLILSKKQYTQGLISLYTLQQYEQEYEKANAQLPIYANNVVVSSNALKLLLNENPGKIGIKYKFMDLNSNGIIPTNLPSEVLLNRPDVRQAEQNLAGATANVGRVTSTFFPTISLIGVAATSSNALRNLFASGNDYWHNLTLLTVPLIDPEFLGQLKSAKGLRYAAFRDYIQVVRQAFKSVDNDLSAHQKYYDSFISQGKNFKSSDKAYVLAKASYKQGLYSYPTLLVNKINMDKAAIDLTKSKIAQLNTIVQLYQDLGGGYAYQCRTKECKAKA